MSSTAAPASAVRSPKAVDDAVDAYKRSRDALKELGSALMEIRALGAQVSAHPTAFGQQRVKWTVPVTQPMMLCSQIQRSGGTLLARLFDGHPACFAHPYELRWGRPRKWHWPQIDAGGDVSPEEILAQLDEGWPRRFSAVGYEKYSKWTREHLPGRPRRYPFLFDASVQAKIFAKKVARTDRSQRSILNAYLTSLFNAWLDYQNLYRTPKQWVTAFTPKLVMIDGEVDRFFADYPDGLIVTIVRHPGEWLSSTMRHVSDTDPDDALNQWLKCAEASLGAHGGHPDRVVVLIFSDLVLQTEAVMRGLCARMGIAFSDVLLEPTYNSMSVLSDSSFDPVTGVDARVTERYRQALSPELLELVERKAMPRFNELAGRFAVA